MIEITLGGSNAPICHGAGITTTTLSDIIHEIEFVNARGEIQRITADNKDLIKSAAGAFGLIGVTTSLTFKMDPMTYANFSCFKEDILEGVPFPANYYNLQNIP